MKSPFLDEVTTPASIHDSPILLRLHAKGDNWLKSFIASVRKHLPILPAHIVSPYVCPRCLPTLSAHQIYLNLSVHSIRPFCFIWSSHISNSISHCVTRPCIVAVSSNGCKSLRLTDNESEEEGWCIEPSSRPELVSGFLICFHLFAISLKTGTTWLLINRVEAKLVGLTNGWVRLLIVTRATSQTKQMQFLNCITGTKLHLIQGKLLGLQSDCLQ